MPNSKLYVPALWEKIVAYLAAGIIIGFSMYLIWLDRPVSNDLARQAYKLILSLAAGGFVGMLPGFFNISWKSKSGFSVRAGGAVAVMILVYALSPGAFDKLALTGKMLEANSKADGSARVAIDKINTFFMRPKIAAEWSAMSFAERRLLMDQWLAVDGNPNAVVMLVNVAHENHLCGQAGNCSMPPLCNSLFGETSRVFTEFSFYLEGLKKSGLQQEVTNARKFINCDCFENMQKVRVDDKGKPMEGWRNLPRQCPRTWSRQVMDYFGKFVQIG